MEQRGKTTSEEPQPTEEDAPVIEDTPEEEDVNIFDKGEEEVNVDGERKEEDRAPEGGVQAGEEARAPEGEGQAGVEEKGEVEDLQDFSIEVFRLAVPVEDRSAEKILEAIIYLYLQLRADGYPIQQIHTDRAREFVAKGFTKWCLVRGIHKTTTSGDSPQQNGRVERAVQAVKSRIRTILLHKGWKADMWPLACWNVHAMERLRRLKKEHTVPGFGAKVLVRKRFWKSRELEPTHEIVEYIATLPEAHGHLVRGENGALMIASYVLQRTEQPPELEDTWLGIQTVAENKEDAMEIRRRIRGKTSVRTLRADEGQGDQMARKRCVAEIVENEGITMWEDEEETAKLVYRLLRVLAKELKTEPEEDEVLRTKVVPVSQFLKEHEMWRPAIMAEMNQLFEEKGALRRTTMADLQDLRERGVEVELIPSKLVITMKPGPKRKIRIVACGNYVESKGEELFAAGADSTALRLALKLTAQLKWTLLTVDIRVAFLNAPLTTTLKDGSEDTAVFALKPPALLVKLNFAKSDEVWVAERAIYGLRQSPRSWSLHRDEVLRGLHLRGYELRQAVSEPNLWIVESEDQKLCGVILVYVDDMMITGETGMAKMIVTELQKIWQTSEPEGIDGGKPTKFLGMEIEKIGENIKASQASFIKDRLNVNLGENWMEMRGSTTPCNRDVGETEDEKDVTTEMVREAQRVVGELLWLVTRTRIDLMYITSRLSQLVLRAPREVVRASRQIWTYFKRTAAQGLLFTPEAGEG